MLLLLFSYRCLNYKIFLDITHYVIVVVMAEPPISNEQRKALDMALSGHSFLLTGKPGMFQSKAAYYQLTIMALLYVVIILIRPEQLQGQIWVSCIMPF